MSRRRQKSPPPRVRDLDKISPPPRRRLWLFRAIALVLPFVLLALLELGLRLAGYGYDTSFFKRIQIGGQDYYVQNENFSYRFFPRDVARNPGALRLPVHKPPGAYRIFIFGESAAMGDPEPAYGASRYLEMLLRAKYPDRQFEIINTAFTAINSHVIVPIARECAHKDGDLWIVYMGNNEMVGPFGAATVFGMQAPPLPYVRLVLAIQKTRTGQLLTDLARRFGRRGTPSTSWGGMEMFMQNQIAPDNPRRENVYRNFAQNLDDILRAGVDSGAKVLLNTVAVNLKDCPPFASMINSNLTAAEREQFDQSFAAGHSAEIQGNFTTAMQAYEQAAKIDPHCAELQYHWGKCLLALHQEPAAHTHLQLACDTDALPFRTDSRLNHLIVASASQFPGSQLKLLDTATVLESQTMNGICGDETFYEHVHFDFDGSYRLAMAWAQQVALMLPAETHQKNGWLSQVECEQMLGLSDWNRALVTEHMVGRMRIPPLSGQEDNAARIQRLEARVQALHARMDTNDQAAARQNFEQQLARYPDDYTLHENYALFLQATGDLPDSVVEWRRVHDLIPQDFLAYFQIGRLLGQQSQFAEAETSLRQALAIHPSLTEGWQELGNILAAEGKSDDALASYRVARQQHPQDAQTVLRMGMVYARLSQPDRAVELYREAIRLNPGDWQAHFELGGAMDAAGQLDAARNEFGAAVQLNPGYSRAHFNYGVILAKQGRLDDAQHEFEEALRLEPGYKNAEDSLNKIRLLRRQSAADPSP